LNIHLFLKVPIIKSMYNQSSEINISMNSISEQLFPDKSAIDTRKAKILVVDDLVENTTMIEAIFRKNGYTNIFIQNDSRRVIDMTIETEYDLVILDINMPFKSGMEILKELKKIYIDAYAPVFILTANLSREIRIAALQNGAQDFLEKPFDPVEFIHRASNIIYTRLLFNSHRMSNEYMELKIRERTRNLEEARKDIILRLGRMAEYRDNETGDHVMRVSKISGILARGYGMDFRKVEMIELVAPMHDVGKVGIPDHILLKPDKLTDEEFKLMQTHTLIGEDILANHPSEVIQVASKVARSHHEKWDGSGYPDNLKADDIPVECRIISVADVFDALTSARPYKEPWPIQKAHDKILELSGTHFEPAIVDIFSRKITEIIEVINLYKY